MKKKRSGGPRQKKTEVDHEGYKRKTNRMEQKTLEYRK